MRLLLAVCIACGAFGTVTGACTSFIERWNEQRYGAEVSSYRFEWVGVFGIPGVVLVAASQPVDRQLGTIRAATIFVTAAANGLAYFIAATAIGLPWLLLQRRS